LLVGNREEVMPSMMIDFAIEAQRSGKTAAEAITEACLYCARPIMMNTMCAVVASLPIGSALAGWRSAEIHGMA